MAFTQMDFNPADGLLSVTEYPTQPASETAARTQLMAPSLQLKNYINGTLLTQLASPEAGISGAHKIGSAAIPFVEGNTVHAQIANLKDQIDDLQITATGLRDDIIQTSYLQDGCVTAQKLALSFAGIVFPYAGNSAPSGFLLCDGSAVPRAAYAALFAVIGATYGGGDGSTTFNVPNLKGKVICGYNAADTDFNSLGKTGGEKTHTLTSAESGLPAHNHELANLQPFQQSDSPQYGYGSGPRSAVFVDGGWNSINNNTASNATSAHNNLQPYVVLNYVIKT